MTQGRKRQKLGAGSDTTSASKTYVIQTEQPLTLKPICSSNKKGLMSPQVGFTPPPKFFERMMYQRRNNFDARIDGTTTPPHTPPHTHTSETSRTASPTPVPLPRIMSHKVLLADTASSPNLSPGATSDGTLFINTFTTLIQFELLSKSSELIEG